MRKFVSTIAVLLALVGSTLRAQIHLTPVVHYPDGQQSYNHMGRSLIAKMSQAINATGIAKSYDQARFVLAVNVVVNNKVVMNTAPTQVAYDVDFQFVIGDGLAGTQFASYSIPAKGVGSTEDRALLSAINGTKFADLKDLVERGRQRIISYYNEQLPAILARAKSLAGQRDYDKALAELDAVPEECRGYAQVRQEMTRIYKDYLNGHSSQLLMQAEALWASDPSERNAGHIMSLLSGIDPSTPAYAGAKQLLKRIEQKYERREQRQHDREMSQIRAIKEIMVAQAKNQPKVVYNIRGWW